MSETRVDRTLQKATFSGPEVKRNPATGAASRDKQPEPATASHRQGQPQQGISGQQNNKIKLQNGILEHTVKSKGACDRKGRNSIFQLIEH